MAGKTQTFFCMKCKEKRISGVLSTSVTGNRKLLRGKCPRCGTSLAKFASAK